MSAGQHGSKIKEANKDEKEPESESDTTKPK